jgi:hypothetical protein
MGRVADRLEHGREDVEGDLGCLGNALVLVELVKERVSVAAGYGQQSILAPALGDLDAADALIRRTQERITSRYKGTHGQ